MIKTVSFAPPRSARAAKAASKSASKPAPVQPARAAAPATTAARPAKTQPARASSGSSPVASAEEKSTAPRRRAAAKAPKVAPTEALAPAEAAPKPTVPKKARAAKVAPATVAATVATAPAPAVVAAKTPAKRGAVKAVEVAEKTEIAPAAASPAAVATPRIKRSRAPKDLALQYGAAPATEEAPRNVAPKPAPRKRMTRDAKAARSQMLRPDDDVLQRLQQANAVEVKKPASRGRGWEFECGRCGRVSRFQTPGAICECGAIAVKE